MSRRRYRYTGKERDEETGLYYHGARYYAAWLGRWTAADPAGLVDGPNLYEYVTGDPILLMDPDGMQLKNLDAAGRSARGSGAMVPNGVIVDMYDDSVQVVPLTIDVSMPPMPDVEPVAPKPTVHSTGNVHGDQANADWRAYFEARGVGTPRRDGTVSAAPSSGCAA